jgi:hypothetical protein
MGFPVGQDSAAGDAFLRGRSTYTSGSATIEMTGQPATTVVLDALSKGPHVYPDHGTNVTWRGDGGWTLQVDVFDSYAPFAARPEGSVQVHRITEGAHFATVDPSRCVVTVTESTDEHLAGTAICRGLAMADVFDDPYVAFAVPIGVDTFDAEITFEAER